MSKYWCKPTQEEMLKELMTIKKRLLIKEKIYTRKEVNKMTTSQLMDVKRR